MNDPTELSQNLIQRLDYYVYLYINPLDNKIFYVGKGNGNRVLSHLNNEGDSDKARKIREIRAEGKQPRIEILRHGLDEKTAFNIEAAVIDVIGISNLTNEIRVVTDQGRMPLWLLPSILDPQDAEIEEPSILIRINQLYRYGMSDVALYEATRGIWTLSKKRSKSAKYAFSIFRGTVMEVYKISSWHDAGTTPYSTRPNVMRELLDDDYQERLEFCGDPAEKEIREKYLLKSVKKYLSNNSQNPIKYVKC
jgi:hypothetical protein